MKKNNLKIIIAISAVLVVLIAATAVIFGVRSKNKPADEEPTPEVVYVVKFDSAGGTFVADQSVKAGGKITEPSVPIKNGYKFAGWYYLGFPWEFSEAVNENMLLTAKWYDASAVYRVTTGVQTTLANRGSAQIEGQPSGTGKYGEGDKVTLIATPNEGFKFSGWVDNDTGKVVSVEQTYTFIVEKDVVLSASFDYALDGLDKPANEKLWRAIESLDLKNGNAALTVDDGENEQTYFITISKDQGVYVFEKAGEDPYGYMVTASGDDVKVYRCENGEKGEEIEISDEVKNLLIILSAEDDYEFEGDFDENNLRIAVYTALMKDAKLTDNGVEATLYAEEYLQSMHDIYSKNAEKTIYQIIYPYLRDAYDASIGEILNNPLYSYMTKNISLRDLVRIMSPAQSGVTVGSVTDFVYDTIDELNEKFAEYGLEFDAQKAKDKFDEIFDEPIVDVIDGLDKALSEGSYADIYEDVELEVALAYALVKNFKIKDLASVIIHGVGLDGTEWDFTDDERKPNSAVANFKFLLDGNEVTSVTVETKAGGKTITLVFTPDINDQN